MNLRWRSGLLVLGVCELCCSLVASCGNTNLYLGDDWEVGGGGAGGAGGAAQGDGTCAPLGQCAPAPPETWWIEAHRFLFWVGPLDAAPPPCPEQALLQSAPTYYEGLVVPEKCELCICQAPDGVCELPTELAAYAAKLPRVPSSALRPVQGSQAPSSALRPVQGSQAPRALSALSSFVLISERRSLPSI
jgi:hypothetical protein